MSLAQGVSAGSANTENETGNAFRHINNFSRPADSRVSIVDKNFTEGSGPSLELIGEYLKCLRKMQRAN